MSGDEEMNKIIEEARATLRRTSPDEMRRRREPLVEPDRVEKWKRDMQELVDARELERQRMDTVQQLCRVAAHTRTEIAEGLASVGKLASALTNRFEEMSDEIADLRARLVVSEKRFEDLKRTVDARTSSPAEVVELPTLPRRA
jgi:hypothetical protein